MNEPLPILILEDNSFDAELVARQLDRGGLSARCRVVSSEAAFRSALSESAPQVIISDFSLPGFDGMSALDIAAREAPSVPFIFVSGTIGEERAIEALKRGAADYVLKDNLKRLVPAIEAALRQAEALDAKEVAEEKLRAREARLSDIIETSHAWIWECDAQGRYTFSSPSVAAVLGYSADEAIGRPGRDYVHPDDRPRFDELFDRLRNGPGGALQTTLRCRSKGGDTRWLERDAVALRNDNGDFVGARGADRDVTERKTQELRIRRLNRALAFLSEANSAMLRIRAREELLAEACRCAVDVGGYSVATIYIRPAEGGEPLVTRAVTRALKHTDMRLRLESLDGTGPVAQSLQSAHAIVSEHGTGDPDETAERSDLLPFGLVSSAALPLTLDDTPIGVLQLHSSEAAVFEQAELDLLSQVTDNIAFALQYLHSQDTTRFLQYFDPLTSLPKRALFVQRLGAAIQNAAREPQALAVLAFNIKNLGMINDSLGRAAGDLALQLVAERLKNRFRNANCLAHLGGGSYAVVDSEPMGACDSGTALSEDVYRLFDEAFTLFDQEVRVSIRAGLAVYPDDARDANRLLHCAETALAKARDAGEGLLRHHAGMNVEAAKRLDLTSRLRRAVFERRFELHYQAKLSLESGRVDGVEALLRWRDPQQGVIPPDMFVPMLESDGLIDEVGRWVIAQALKESADWAEVIGSPLPVAVNVSPLQLRRSDFAEDVLGLLQRSQISGRRLELEITESMLMGDIDMTIGTLGRLRDAHVTVAIDDFGTGYSSLKVLSQLPVDVLKIDRSFVSALGTGRHDRTVVQTTISLADALGMKTIAEGIETREQIRILAELGCRSVQGYYLHRPMPAHDIRAWLVATRGRVPSDCLADWRRNATGRVRASGRAGDRASR